MRQREVCGDPGTGAWAWCARRYSAGKPAYGVGPGNAPAYIERAADIPKAVREKHHHGQDLRSRGALLVGELRGGRRGDRRHRASAVRGAWRSLLSPAEADTLARLLVTPQRLPKPRARGEVRAGHRGAYAGLSVLRPSHAPVSCAAALVRPTAAPTSLSRSSHSEMLKPGAVLLSWSRRTLGGQAWTSFAMPQQSPPPIRRGSGPHDPRASTSTSGPTRRSSLQFGLYDPSHAFRCVTRPDDASSLGPDAGLTAPR